MGLVLEVEIVKAKNCTCDETKGTFVASPQSRGWVQSAAQIPHSGNVFTVDAAKMKASPVPYKFVFWLIA